MGPRAGKRRSLRRAVSWECDLRSNLWEGALSLPTSDVSNEGLWLDTQYALEPGEELVLSFTPPGAGPRDQLWAVAEVARVGMWRRRWDPWAVGMGLSFTYFSDIDRRFLARSLLGRPPRLPGRKRPPPLPHQRGPRARPEPYVLKLEDLVFDDDLPAIVTPVHAPELPPVLDVELSQSWHQLLKPTWPSSAGQ